LAEGGEKPFYKVCGEGELVFVTVKEFFLSGEGGSDVEDGEVHACGEVVKGVEERAFAYLLVL
jgi:hypothetical protein